MGAISRICMPLLPCSQNLLRASSQVPCPNTACSDTVFPCSDHVCILGMPDRLQHLLSCKHPSSLEVHPGAAPSAWQSRGRRRRRCRRW